MPEKKKGTNTVGIVRELAQPIAERLGVILWDVRFVKEGAERCLRIIIDKPGGISIDDCVDMSHALDAPLDELDPIQESYSLQVQSPGLERELVRDEHFAAYTGARVMVKFHTAVNGSKEHKGVLVSHDAEKTRVEADGGEVLEFTKKDAVWVKLDDFGGFGDA